MSFAQQANEKFGQNRVQYKNFDWKSLNTKHFTIYYYSGGNEIAHNAARYAEMDFNKISNDLGYIPRSKLTLIVYNSTGDIQQSNIGISSDNYLGGETNFVKSKIEIAFPGTQVDFRKEIRYKISKVLLNYIMFGGNLKEVVQSNYMMNLPQWFIDGAAAYIAEKGTSDMHDFMYNHIHKRNVDIAKIIGQDAELAGMAFWSFLAEKYGSSIVPNLINITRLTHDEKIGISTTVNIPYKIIMREWVDHYSNLFNQDIRHQHSERNILINWHNYQLKQISFSPDSSLLAYSYHSQGKQKIIIKDTSTGKRKQIHVRYFKTIDLPTNTKTPLISWKSNKELSYLTYKKGKPFFATYDLKKGRTTRKKFEYFDQILSFDHNPINENEIVLSAVQKGQSDIFTYNFKSNAAIRLTKDLYDDLYPRYLPKSNRFIFSSNRQSDTLGIDAGSFDNIKDSFDLFILSPENLILDRVTNSLVSEYKAIPIDDSTFVTTARMNHQENLFKIDLHSNQAHQILEYDPSISDFTLSNNSIHLIRRERKTNAAVHYPLNLDTSYFTYDRIKTVNKDSSTKTEVLQYEEAINFLLTVDLDEISFDSSLVDTTKDIYTILREIEEVNVDLINIYGPNKYKRSLGLDNFVSSFLIDPLRGLSVLLDANLSELFGNHQFSGDFLIANDLKSNIINIEYDYLPKRIDFTARLKREDINRAAIVKYGLTRLEIGGSYPFNQVSKVYFNPSYTTTGIANLLFPSVDNQYNHYLGYSSGFVFDNTSVFGLNMMRGTRAKVELNQFSNTSNAERNFGEFRTDIRHYQKVFDELTLAVRGSYGQYFGEGSKKYLLGGMDNWFISQSDGLDEPPLNLDSGDEDVLFLDYVTGLRGFNYNALYGRQHLLFNTELRLPIARLIKNRPIQSKFYKNLQFVTFYDVGTTWNSGNIFSKENDVSEGDLEQYPFDITYTKYTSPFLSSYGIGMRTMMLGYYMKFDLAWGVENYNVNTPKLHLTIGYDF